MIFRVRRGTAFEAVSENPILRRDEVGVETDTLKYKIGDGQTKWNNLHHASEDELISALIRGIWIGYK